jgi:hypothetical protein
MVYQSLETVCFGVAQPPVATINRTDHRSLRANGATEIRKTAVLSQNRISNHQVRSANHSASSVRAGRGALWTGNIHPLNEG